MVGGRGDSVALGALSMFGCVFYFMCPISDFVYSKPSLTRRQISRNIGLVESFSHRGVYPIGTMYFVIAYLKSTPDPTSNILNSRLRKLQRKNIAQTFSELKVEVKKGLVETR